jgi:hypothetical protein
MKLILGLGVYLGALMLAPSAFSEPTESVDVLSELHTIASLSKLTDAELFSLVQYKGFNEACIPQGVSAGKPGRIDKDVINNDNGIKALFGLMFRFLGNHNSQAAADLIWKGKTFRRSSRDCTVGTGVNRVGLINLFTMTVKNLTREVFITDEGRMSDASEQGFVQALEANENDVNMVELNYSKPGLDPLGMGRAFGIRDIMVPIAGKYGTIYIGRAYTGKWTSPTQFKSAGNVAWFFLDFSPEAVAHDRHHL